MKTKTGGLEEVLSNLNKEIQKIEGRTMSGLYEAALKIQATSQQRVPVDTGNLKGSTYVRKDRTGDPSVEIGYTANYAVYVHEMIGQKLKGQQRADFGETREGVAFGGGTGKGSYWDTGQPKFLESALRDNEDAIVDIVQETARVE